MILEQVIVSCLLIWSVHSYTLDISASLRWGEVRDNMLCFVRLSERNIGGVTTARRGTGLNACRTYCSTNTTDREIAYDSPDFSDCGFFQACLSGRCVSLDNLTTRAQSSSDISTGLAALQRLYLSAVFPASAAVTSSGFGGGSSIDSAALAGLLSQASGSALPVLASINGASGAGTGLAPAPNPGAFGSGLGVASNLPSIATALGPLQPSSSAFSVASSPVGILPAFVATSGSQVGGGLDSALGGNGGAGTGRDVANAVSALGSMASSGAELASGGARLGTSISNLVNAANGAPGAAGK